MAFTRDFDDTAPANHTLNSAWPLEARKIKVDIADRLSAIISGFVSGETVKGILALPFKAVTKPTVIADQIQLYAKDVSGKTELFTLTEDATENQVTTDGKFTPAAASLLALVGPLLMPVGYVLTLGVNTNPATLFGFGTWTAIAGKVIVGIDGTQTEFDTLNETGGSKTVTLDETMIPSHVHAVHRRLSDSGAVGPIQADYVAGGGNNTVQTDASTTATGGGLAHENMPPYIVKYVWQRTA